MTIMCCLYTTTPEVGTAIGNHHASLSWLSLSIADCTMPRSVDSSDGFTRDSNVSRSRSSGEDCEWEGCLSPPCQPLIDTDMRQLFQSDPKDFSAILVLHELL